MSEKQQLPEVLYVKSQVRRQHTRLVRAKQPTRHRFKQYLFSDPSLRMVRNRSVRVKTSDILANLDELLAKEAVGILSVHTADGGRVCLNSLRNGDLVAYSKAPTFGGIPNRQLDSIANDIPAGIPLPDYVNGSFAGDPAAERVIEEIVAEKHEETSSEEVPVSELLSELDAVVGVDSQDPAAQRAEHQKRRKGRR